LAKPFALAITISWTMMFSRVLVEVATINPSLFGSIWVPLVIAGAIGLGYCVFLYFSQKPEEEGDLTLANPFELGPALKFGLIYAVILIISRTTQLYLGDFGILVSSALSGLADVDAITLSVAQLSQSGGGLEISTASNAIILAAMANTVTKGALVMITGSRGLRRAILPGFLLILFAGIGIGFLV
jgi:uncharacterized membrane protein (DUF4010 family)